jgi:hypothetical protein
VDFWEEEGDGELGGFGRFGFSGGLLFGFLFGCGELRLREGGFRRCCADAFSWISSRFGSSFLRPGEGTVFVLTRFAD